MRPEDAHFRVDACKCKNDVELKSIQQFRVDFTTLLAIPMLLIGLCQNQESEEFARCLPYVDFNKIMSNQRDYENDGNLSTNRSRAHRTLRTGRPVTR